MLKDIVGMNVLVFGGSSGIGAAAVEDFARHGANVVVHYAKGKERAQQVARAAKKHGTKVKLVAGDLFEPGTASRVVEGAANALGGLDVLINNAGAMVGRARLQEADRTLYDNVMNLNVWAVIEASQAALPYLKQSSAPSIINVSSMAARMGGGPGAGIYAAAKAFVSNFTRNMAKDLAEERIRVNAIAPGLIDTAFHDETPESVFKGFASGVPLGRAGTPEDCTGALLFLASAAMSGYVTGHCIEINGGLLMI